MQVFYAPDINCDIFYLDENESKHVIRVLRMKPGMQVMLIDGKGNLYEGEIADDNPKRCRIIIRNVRPGFEKRNYSLHLAISPLKNSDRFEWFVEKSVEIGIDIITPLLCHNTEKESVKESRINSIIISAMKQSLKATGTVFNKPVGFNEFVSSDLSGNKMIAHCNSSFVRKKITDAYEKSRDAVILIGPEGDFSEDEIKYSIEKGFECIHLGASRLRTETAGIAACHSVYLINQE